MFHLILGTINKFRLLVDFFILVQYYVQYFTLYTMLVQYYPLPLPSSSKYDL